MPTALDVMRDGLEWLGVYAPGETLPDSDAERCLVVLNDMIDSWSNESLFCFAIFEQNFTLLPNKQTYTIGTTGGADINQMRPIRINMGPGTAYFQDNNGNNYDCDVVTRVQWNQIGNRSLNDNSNIPSKLFYDPQFPLGIINLFPTYNGGIPLTCFFDSYQQLSEFSSLTGTVNFPPGYSLAIKRNFGLMAGPYFKPEGWTPSAEMKQQAMDAKAAIKRSNKRADPIVYDPELLPRAAATYNVYSDRGG